MSDGYACQGDLYCEYCAPDIDPETGEEPCPVNMFGSHETDSPSHCGACGRPIDCDLTSEGVEYVLDAIREDLQDLSQRSHTFGTMGAESDLTYYCGGPAYSILVDWCDLISDPLSDAYLWIRGQGGHTDREWRRQVSEHAAGLMEYGRRDDARLVLGALRQQNWTRG